MRQVGGLLVDAAFGQRGQLLVGSLLLVQRLLQQLDRLVVPHRLRPGHERAVRGHLVVLGALRGRNQQRVHGGLVGIFLERALGLFEDAGHAVAVLAARLLAEALEHAGETIDLAPGFLEVLLECGAEVGRRGGLGHLRERLGELLLCVECVAKFVDERVVQGALHGHVLWAP